MLIEHMQAYYDQRADEYDKSMGYDDPLNILVLVPVIDELKKLVKDKLVLELACGPGFWTSHIIETAEFVTATDYNQSTLNQAIAKGLPVSKVNFAQADAYDLTGREGNYELLMAVDWLAHVPLSKISTFLKGVSQRLGAGSSVIFLDQLPGSHSLTGEFDQEGNHIQNRTLQNGESFKVIKHFFSKQQYEALFNPHFSKLCIKQFPGCRRILVSAKID